MNKKKSLVSKNAAFVLILAVFVLLYTSLTFHIPLLGNLGVGAYVLIALSQVG